ncbi:MAG: dihydroorotate dehydrogenase electron transfer subunit [bacterium]|nr:dihydroorotate dehydrogenase electron transfer subunit [bacterium]
MRVVKNECLKGGIFLLTIEDKEIATTSEPGQFVHIRVTDNYIPLLRRPFSIHCIEGDTFKVLYKVVGIGTKLLSSYKSGTKLDIIGPLGDGFDTSNYRRLTFVAGGIGVAPLYFLATCNKDKNLTILIGASTKEKVLCEAEFRELGNVIVATEDGSYGVKGVVTDLLTTVEKPDLLLACGPSQMLKFIRSYVLTHSIPCQLCLEQHMACGIGVCLGCAVKSKDGYKHVCKDGPVFWADEVEI